MDTDTTSNQRWHKRMKALWWLPDDNNNVVNFLFRIAVFLSFLDLLLRPHFPRPLLAEALYFSVFNAL